MLLAQPGPYGHRRRADDGTRRGRTIPLVIVSSGAIPIAWTANKGNIIGRMPLHIQVAKAATRNILNRLVLEGGKLDRVDEAGAGLAVLGKLDAFP